MKIKNIITLLLCGAFILSFAGWCILGTTPAYSESERRVLAEFPEVSWDKIVSGEFAGDFEDYATDRFPLRDFWRGLKASVRLNLFQQKDNNDIYYADGHISKLEYPANPAMQDYAISLFTSVYEKYLSGNRVFFSMIPDKNRDLAELSMDYDAFEKYMIAGLPFATPIHIGDFLTAEDFYNTDTHWRQENIVDIAAHLAASMGTSISGNYEQTTLETPFNGVYVGQSALPFEPDHITILENDVIRGFKVTGAAAVYDLAKAESRDPYELFLSGTQPLVTIKNPANPAGGRLILFRDSFGSSIAPLLAEGYSEVVLVDLRYVSSGMLGELVDFTDADVLFLYSTILLNSSTAMK